MKATELQLNDLVLDQYGKIARVTSMSEVMIVTKLDGVMTLSRPEQVQPIPLTDEILEKNGFRKTWNGDWQLKEYATIIISKDYYVKVFERSIRIDYVHELQHALHAACIEKEIEL